MRAVCLGLLLIVCGCAWTSDVKKTDQTETEWAEHHDRIERTHQEGSEFDTKTVREEQAAVVETPDGPLLVRVPRNGTPVKLPKGSKLVGTVPLTTTTIDQDAHVGAKDTTNQDTGDKEKKKKDDIKTEAQKEVGLPWKFYLAGLFGILLAIAGIFFYVKFVTKRVLP